MLTLATYWHTSMADRYDINDIGQLSFVSILCWYLPWCELPSRSVSWVKLYLLRTVVVSPEWMNTLLVLKPLCIVSTVFFPWQADQSFLLTSRPCPIPKIFSAHLILFLCISWQHVSQRGLGSGRLCFLNANCMALSSDLPVSVFWSPRFCVLTSPFLLSDLPVYLYKNLHLSFVTIGCLWAYPSSQSPG